MSPKPLVLLSLALLTAPLPAQRRVSAAVPRRTATASSAAIHNVFWEPNGVLQGSPVLFTVELDKPAARVSATWIGKSLMFFKEPGTNLWHALAGDDLETPPGSYKLEVTAVLAGGRIARSTKPVDVVAAPFGQGSIDVPENFVEPDAAGRKQIAQDSVAKARAYAHVSANPQWSGNFAAPVSGASTPTFGESRILNEEKTSTHRGTDYPVPEGTSVLAANAGTVVLAREMFYEGNCIIIDHGGKFFTIYMHLSKMNVAVGDRVDKGAKLGVSGATGRVTGAHLHVGVRWNGAYLDPVELFKLTLPKTAASTSSSKSASRSASHRRTARR